VTGTRSCPSASHEGTRDYQCPMPFPSPMLCSLERFVSASHLCDFRGSHVTCSAGSSLSPPGVPGEKRNSRGVGSSFWRGQCSIRAYLGPRWFGQGDQVPCLPTSLHIIMDETILSSTPVFSLYSYMFLYFISTLPFECW
jgi:hypothetical protein